MFGIGWSELAVILCVAIIFIHPKDLPALFRKLGRLYSKVKKVYAEIVATKDQFVKDIEDAAALEEKKDAQAKAAAASPGDKASDATAAAIANGPLESVPAAPAGEEKPASPPELGAQPEAPPAADAGAEPNDVPVGEPSESSPYIHPSSVE